MQETILLVDDDPNVLKIMEYTFREEGYSIVTAGNGVKALEAVRAHHPALIIADVMMPAMDGYELCRRIRSDREFGAVPFIFLSARATTEDRLAGLELGADDYVTKPFDRRELVARAKAMLNRGRIYRTHAATSDTEEGVEPLPFLVPDLTDEQAEAPRRPPTVLVVDDDAAMRAIAMAVLRRTEARLVEAGDGEEALALSIGDPPDVVIADVSMPGMSGPALRKAFLERSELAGAAFLFLTGQASPEDVEHAMRKGTDDFIAKPLNPQLLVTKVRTLLERSRSQAGGGRQQIAEAARRMSSHLEPNVPKLAGIEIAQDLRPLDIRGGDYCDYVPLADGTVAVVVGDVMGKKWGAWFFSVAYIAYLRSVIRSVSTEETPASPAAIVRRVNRLLWEDLKVSEVFTTLFLGILDPARRTVTFSSAGHPPPVHLTARDGRATQGEQPGLILGVQPDFAYSERTLRLEKGDSVVIYSDGITETMDPTGELFGDERLAETVETEASADARHMAAAIYRDIDAFGRNAPAQDDRTVVVIRATA